MSSFTYDDTASGFVEDNFSQTSVPNFFNKVSTATLALEEGLKEFLENGILIYIDSDNLDSYILPTTVVDGRLNPQIEKQFKDFKLVVFMHVDGVKINRYNKVIEPAADELVILLEVNDAGNYFGSVMYAKVGANLKRRDWPLSDIFIDLDNREANISKRDLQVLLTKANFASKATLFSAFSKLIATIRGFAFNKVMNFLASITELALADGIRELKILEKFWNPEDPAYTKRYVSEGIYLLLQEKARAEVSLAEMIDPVINAACTALTAAGKQDLGSMLGKVKGVPPKLRKFMTEASIAINDETAKIISFLKASREDLARIILQCGVEFANGLICGLINGFLEAVAGIFDLFALILRVAGALSKGWFTNKLEVFLNFKEMLENFLEAIKLYKLFDYVKLLFDIPSGIFKAILDSKIDINEVTAFLSVQFGKVSAAKVGYAIGYIIGTIIEVVLEVIATGGVAAAVKIVEYTQKLFTGVANATKHAFKAARGVTLDIATTIQTSLSMLFDSLRKGTAIDDLKKWIDELILEIKKVLGLVDENTSKIKEAIDDVKSGKTKLDENKDGTKKRGHDFTRGANFAEMVAHEDILSMKSLFGKEVKYKPLFEVITDIDAAIVKGIDGLYINELFKPPPPPNKYLVNEVKHNSTGKLGWIPKMSTTVTKSGGSQMQAKWIRYNLFDGFDIQLAKDVLKSGYDAILTGVSRKGDDIVRYHIKDPLAKQLEKI